MAFECFRCGECCAHLGLVYSVIEDRGDYQYLVRNGYTGETTRVTVDPAFRGLYDDMKIYGSYPHACPFFRRQEETGLSCCTIHATRPEICRDYECWRLLILDHRGRRAGRVRYRRMLLSDNDHLTRVWKECIEDLRMEDDRQWEDEMRRFLLRAGYSVRM